MDDTTEVGPRDYISTDLAIRKATNRTIYTVAIVSPIFDGWT